MKRIIAFVILTALISGCIKNNPDPSWIEIKEWTLVDNPDAPIGELTHNFSNAWVYVDNEFVGIFEVPCKIPVLKEGAKSVTLIPTVLNNGISATKKAYPFVSEYEITVDLVKNETVTINPTTSYYSTVNYAIEDFESIDMHIISDQESQTDMIQITDPTNASNKIGRVLLDNTTNKWIAYWDESLYLSSGNEVYLELDYYNTNEINTGMIAIKSDGSSEVIDNITLSAQTPTDVKWKKIYIDLKELVRNSNGIEFLQTFQATLDGGDSQGLIYLDNIKVIYF